MEVNTMLDMLTFMAVIGVTGMVAEWYFSR